MSHNYGWILSHDHTDILKSILSIFKPIRTVRERETLLFVSNHVLFTFYKNYSQLERAGRRRFNIIIKIKIDHRKMCWLFVYCFQEQIDINANWPNVTSTIKKVIGKQLKANITKKNSNCKTYKNRSFIYMPVWYN